MHGPPSHDHLHPGLLREAQQGLIDDPPTALPEVESHSVNCQDNTGEVMVLMTDANHTARCTGRADLAGRDPRSDNRPLAGLVFR